MSASEQIAHRQRMRVANRSVALRRLLLDGKGNLNREAKLLVADFRRFCRADAPLIQYSAQTGMVDPIATAAAAARREVWDRYANLLHLDLSILLNVKDDDL